MTGGARTVVASAATEGEHFPGMQFEKWPTLFKKWPPQKFFGLRFELRRMPPRSRGERRHACMLPDGATTVRQTLGRGFKRNRLVSPTGLNCITDCRCGRPAQRRQVHSRSHYRISWIDTHSRFPQNTRRSNEPLPALSTALRTILVPGNSREKP